MKNNFIQTYLDGGELDTPSKILLAALEEFGKAPVKNVGTRDIAKRAGVNIALINYYFKGKDELYAELVNQIIAHFCNISAQFDTRFEALLSNPSKARAKAFMKDYIAWRVSKMSSDNDIFKSIISIVIREEIDNSVLFKKIYTQHISRNYEIFTECVKICLGAEVDNETVRLIALTILNQIDRFNTSPNAVKLAMNWNALSRKRIEKIYNVLSRILDCLL